MNQEQIDYVKTELGNGVSPEAITQALAGAGYEQAQIEQLLQAAQGQVTSQIPAAPSVPVRSGGLPIWAKILIGVAALVLLIGAILVSVVFSSLNSARDSTNDAADMTSLNNLRNLAEVHYSTSGFSYVGFCESSRSQSLLLGLADPDCVAEKENYRVSTRLLSGEYYCVDSGGRAERLATEPTGFSCLQMTQQEAENSLSDTRDTQSLEFMRTDIEIFYTENEFSYSGFCESGEGVTFTGDMERYECVASDMDYRISVDLLTGGYYCIDGTGFARELATEPTGLSCE